MTGRRALAEEVPKDALVGAFDKLGELEDPPRFGSWLGQIAPRRAIDLLRSESRLDQLQESDGAGVEWIDRSDDESDLQAAVALLPTDRRAVVVMRYWLDLTPPEIAESLELPLGTVHSRLGRALADLRERLAESRHA